MAGSIYRRGTFLPVRAISGSGVYDVVLALDWYAARYNGIFSTVKVFTAYQVSDDSEGRLDIIANQVYGDVELWWVIGIYNGIINPLQEVVTGMFLRIPDRTQMEFLLQNKANDSSSFAFPGASSSGNVTVELR